MSEPTPRRRKGTGSIAYKAREGRWRGVLRHESATYYVYGQSEKAIESALRHLRTDLERNKAPLPATETTGHFLKRWLADVVKPRARPSTYRNYRLYVERHLKPLHGIPLSRLSPPDVQTLLNKLAERQSPRSVQYARATLRAALRRAQAEDLVARNSAAIASSPSVRSKQVVPMTPVQAQALLAAVQGDRLEALYTVAIACGLRQGEALGLRWQDDIDLDGAVLQVRHSLQRVDGKYVLLEPKTEDSAASVMLPRAAVAKLRAHHARQAAERLAAGMGYQDWGLVFCREDGYPLDGATVTRAFQHHLAKTGLPRFRFHDLRHSCASLLIAQGCTMKEVQETLRHSSSTITADLYSHLYDEGKRRVADKMDKLLSYPGLLS